MSAAPIVDRIRIIPRPDDFLDRNVGSSGEVFFNKATNSLRVYSGKDRSGFEIARADLANVDINNENINWIPYATLDDLPSATDNHGMFAHVHSTGKAYYAHAGNWVELANQSDLADGAGGGASVDVSVEAPSEPNSGNLWLDLNTGKLYIYINDGDSNQWIQPDLSTFSGNYNDLTNTPAIPSSINDLADVDTVTASPQTGEVLKWDGSKWAPAVDIAAGGVGLDADTLDGQDSAYYLNYDNITNKPTTFNDLILSGVTTLQKTAEILQTITGASGVEVHDLDAGVVFNHTSIAGNFTANFTNVATTENRTISVVLILNQDGTAYIPTALQIDGAAQTINWQGAAVPTGNADQIDIVSFTMIRSASAWTVIGSLTTYG